MGRLYRTYLEADRDVWKCAGCHWDLTYNDDLVSRHFRGLSGTAYLFHHVVNVDLGEEREQLLNTGRHVVQSISCTSCQTVIGWHYVRAFVESEHYKEGKYIVECAYMRLHRAAAGDSEGEEAEERTDSSEEDSGDE